MSESTSRTTLEVRVNAREVNKLDTDLKRTFSPKTTDGLTKGSRELSQAIRDVSRVAQAAKRDLEALANQRQGFKGLTDTIRAAREELARFNQEMARGGGGGGGFGGGAGGGFVSPGAGQPASQHGGGGPISSRQLPMPGMAALATALTSIPYVGLAAAGSLMAAAGAYGSHLAYQGAQVQAAPHLSLASYATNLDQRGIALAGPRVAAAKSGLTKEAAIASILQSTAGLATSSAGDPEAKSPNIRAAMAGVGDVTSSGPVHGRRVPGSPGAALARATSAANAVGAQRDAAIASARAAGAADAVREWFDPSSYIGPGIRYGMGPAEALQAASGMARGARRPVSGREFEFGMATQTLFGVQASATGSLMGGMGRAGVGAGRQADMVADAIGSAVARGLESSEIADYLQQMTGFLEQQTGEGRQVDVASMVRVEERLSRSGVAGWRAGGIARQFGAAGANIGFRGPQSAMEYRLMEAMGFTGRGGFEEYAQKRLDMQDPGKVAAAMPQLIAQISGKSAGLGQAGQALYMQQAFRALSTNLGPDEARSLAKGLASSGFAGGLTSDEIMASGSMAYGGMAGSKQAEAGIEAERVGIGGKVAGDMQSLSRATNNMASTFINALGPAVTAVTTSMEKFTEALDSGTKGLWAGGEKKATQ